MEFPPPPVTTLPQWNYTRPGVERTGRSLSENNFAKEKRDWLAILLREILQNALDAKREDQAFVEVRLRNVEIQATNKKLPLIDEGHVNRYKASSTNTDDIVPDVVRTFLVIEDFGTSGLTGEVNDPDMEGPNQNWNAFWFREGEGGKETGSGNGGAGQGKITYFSASAIRTIYAYTVRHNTMDGAIFGASSFMRDYTFDKKKWKRDAYWGEWSKVDGIDRVAPNQSSATIALFCEKLQLARRPDAPGLSLVIPEPRPIDWQEAIRIIIAEFFVPIYRGNLVVDVGSQRIGRETIVSLANDLLSDEKAERLHTCMTKGYRGFLIRALTNSEADAVHVSNTVSAANKLGESSFTADQLIAMRKGLDNEEIVSVRFLVEIRPKKYNPVLCSFDVHIQCPFHLDHTEHAVVRRDLLVGEEPIGTGKVRQRARGLTLVQDKDLSALLLRAEEATHLRWNTRLPRLRESYIGGETVVAIVRNAMAKLLDTLNEGEQKRDYKSLANYFSAPGHSTSEAPKGRKEPGTRPAVYLPPPPPRPKLLKLDALPDGCLITPTKREGIPLDSLPISVKVEFAYEGLDSDAFDEYDPFDFDLADEKFSIDGAGYDELSNALNEISLNITSPDFRLQITGFDPNLRLRVRLQYSEIENA